MKPSKGLLATFLGLVAGNTFAQILFLISTPFLTRLYTPEQFGNFGVFIGLMAIFTVIVNFKFELAIPVPKSQKHAVYIWNVSLFFATTFFFLVLIVVIFFNPELNVLLGLKESSKILYFLPFSILAMGVSQATNFIHIRSERYSVTSIYKVLFAVVTISLQLAFYSNLTYGLSLGYTLGLVIGAIIVVYKGRTELWLSDLRKIYCTSKRFSDFPKYSMPAGLFNSVGTNVPVILFINFYGAAVAGFYTLAQRVLIAPTTTVGAAVASIYISNARKYLSENVLSKKTIQIHQRLSDYAAPVLFMLLCYGGEVFTKIFGEEWRSGSQVVAVLAPWLYFVFTVSPISTTLVMIKKQKFTAKFDFCVALFRLTTVILCSLQFDFYQTLIVFSAVNTLSVVIYISFVFRFLNCPILSFVVIQSRALFIGMCLVIPSYLLISNIYLSLFVSIILTFVAYVIYYKRSE